MKEKITKVEWCLVALFISLMFTIAIWVYTLLMHYGKVSNKLGIEFYVLATGCSLFLIIGLVLHTQIMKKQYKLD